jgi:hypothetical protein
MNTTKNIIRYAVIPEIDMPLESSEKFNNSDKSWAETNLGCSNTVPVIAFEAVTAAGEELLSNIRGN